MLEQVAGIEPDGVTLGSLGEQADGVFQRQLADLRIDPRSVDCDRLSVWPEVRDDTYAAAWAHRLAPALPEKVEMACPTGVERAGAMNIRIPIEGANDIVAAKEA